MKVFVFLPLLSLLSMGLGCHIRRTTTTATTTTTTRTPIVTRQATSTNSCTGAEGATYLKTISLIRPVGVVGVVITGNAIFTGTGTQKVLCYVVVDRLIAPNQSTFAKTAGDFGTNTVTITAASAVSQPIDADVHFFGTL